MSRSTLVGVIIFAVVVAAAVVLLPASVSTKHAEADTGVAPAWTPEELRTVYSLSLRNLPPLPASESNRYADELGAARLGQQLFFDTRLSSNGEVSCATCHQPQRDFTDGLPVGVGVAPVARHTMSVVGVAYSPWLFWDGRADSLWSQALGPLEDGSEHGGTRTQYAQVIAQHYRDTYENVFGAAVELDRVAGLPASAGPLGNVDELQAWEQMSAADRDTVNRVFANIGKAMDAYQRRLLPQPSRFDAFAEALANGNSGKANELMSATEQQGLKLFIGAADCTHCHNGPLLANNDFHNTAVATENETTLAEGRARGVHRLRSSEFNCLGPYSDASEGSCMELEFMKTQGSDLMSAFRTPPLRNVAKTAPYMHNGRFATLEQVVAHYNDAPASVLGNSELVPLHLDPEQQAQLVAFLKTLDEQSSTPDPWRSPPSADTRTASN